MVYTIGFLLSKSESWFFEYVATRTLRQVSTLSPVPFPVYVNLQL